MAARPFDAADDREESLAIVCRAADTTMRYGAPFNVMRRRLRRLTSRRRAG